MKRQYDIIVIGGGHAGCEAAAAASRLGARVALITSDITKIALMSCNPSIGGIGKGQIVREIDALGGMTGVMADKTCIQYRMLNRSKGAAMHSPRVQCDRDLFTLEWRRFLDGCERLQIIQDSIEQLIIRNGVCEGVVSKYRGEITALRVILTSGTFLNGRIHIGLAHTPGGRIDEGFIPNLSEQLRSAGVETLRFKTGTSPRIDMRSVNKSVFEEQWGDNPEGYFSFSSNQPNGLKKLPCLLGYTNGKTHQIIRDNLDQSPLYQKKIHGRGPRYCPSIEDKIRMFEGKESHQIFLEPESTTGNIVYINGFSSSLPFAVQDRAIRSIVGLENAHIMRPGYAIEYDFFNPKQLYKSLESAVINHLYIAGQLNGTTGYEEAAAQGIMAGINATLSLQGDPPLILNRSEAYIGVMIDDLVNRGVDEPYRMFTSRAENRLSLRHDNADKRLMPYGYKLGLIGEAQYQRCQSKYRQVEANREILGRINVHPEAVNPLLQIKGTPSIEQKTRVVKVLLRPEIHLIDILPLLDSTSRGMLHDSDEVILATEIEIKYQKYIDREAESQRVDAQLERLRIPSSLDFQHISTISYEAREKIAHYKPQNLLQLKNIPGIKPSDIKALIIAINNHVSRGTNGESGL